MDPTFYTKRGLLTRYSFACGYVEKKGGLSLHMEHDVYHVRGFLTKTQDGKETEYHIMGSFSHVKEARKFMAYPFTHVPSRNGSVNITPRSTPS
jgi:hypothetical protein